MDDYKQILERNSKIIEEAQRDLVQNDFAFWDASEKIDKEINGLMMNACSKMAETMQKCQEYDERERRRIELEISNMDNYISNNDVKDKLELYLKYFTRDCYTPFSLKDIIIKREGEDFFNNFEKYFYDYKEYHNLLFQSNKDYGLSDDLNIMEKLDILKKEVTKKKQLQEMQKEQEKNKRITEEIRKEINTCLGIIYYIIFNDYRFEKDEVMVIMNSVNKKQELEKQIEEMQIKIAKTPNIVKNVFSKSFKLKEKTLNDLKANVHKLERQKAHERILESYSNIEKLIRSTDYEYCVDMIWKLQDKIKVNKEGFYINRKKIPLTIKKDDSFSFIYSTNSKYLDEIYTNNLLYECIRYYENIRKICDTVFLEKMEQSLNKEESLNKTL